MFFILLMKSIKGMILRDHYIRDQPQWSIFFVYSSLDWTVARKDLDFLGAKLKLSVDPVKKSEFL